MPRRSNSLAAADNDDNDDDEDDLQVRSRRPSVGHGMSHIGP